MNAPQQPPVTPEKKEAAPAPTKAAARKGLIYVEGFDGQITLLPDRIRITRKGILNILMYGFSAQREIPLSAIAEVVFKEANLMQPGHIEFVVAGRSTLQSGKVNHNAVRFMKQKQSQFHALKEKVFAMMQQNSMQKAQ